MNIRTDFSDSLPPIFVVEDNGGLPVAYGGNSVTTSNPSGVPAVIPPALSDEDIVSNISNSIGSGNGVGRGVVDPYLGHWSMNSLMHSRTHTELGAVGSPNAGLLGIRTPYIAFTFPSAKYPDHYNEHIGRPIETSAPLNSFHGYTVVSAIHLDNVSATLPEKRELESLLMGGVIL